MADLIRIQDQDVEVVEYKGQRVVTHAMIDQVHDHKPGTSRVAFHRNKNHFKEGEHYFVTDRNEAESIGVTAPNGLTLFTERGYRRMCKIFDDDRAWDVFDEMEQVYFGDRPAQIPAMTQTEIVAYLANNQVEMERELAQAKVERAEMKQDIRRLEESRDSLHIPPPGRMTYWDYFRAGGVHPLRGKLYDIYKQKARLMEPCPIFWRAIGAPYEKPYYLPDTLAQAYQETLAEMPQLWVQ